MFSVEEAQAAHLLLPLQAVVGVGMVLHSSKIATEHWPFCSWGFSSHCRFVHGTVSALAAGRASSQRGCSPERVSASGFVYLYPPGQVACWPLPELGGGQGQCFPGFPGSREGVYHAGSLHIGLHRGLAFIQVRPCLYLALEIQIFRSAPQLCPPSHPLPGASCE